MPSKSKSQQRFFGMVDAYKKGELKNASSKIKKAANGMSMDDVKDFAETKHKGLPEKVEENVIRLTESDLHRIVKESVMRILSEEESYVDQMIRRSWERFNRSKLKPIFDNLGLKRGGGGFSLSGDLGYISLKLDNPRVEIREYDNGKVFVHFGYDNNAGAWGGFTRKYEVKDPNIFKKPRWYEIIKRGGMETSPDVIMMGAK